MRFPCGEWRVCYSVYSGGMNELPNGSVSSRRSLHTYYSSIPEGNLPLSIHILQKENLLHRFPEHLRHLQG